jgi:hypothetical protein
VLKELKDRAAGLASPVAGKVYEGRVARIHGDGDPLTYPQFAHPHNEQYRDQAGLEEFNKEFQTSRPFTFYHPDDLIVAGGTPDIVGKTIGSRIEGNHVVVQILVTDQRAMDAIDSGMIELSVGYRSVLNDKRRQSQIQVDHLALVPMARCGPSCALQTDHQDCSGGVQGAAHEPCHCKSRAMGYTTEIVGSTPIQTKPPRNPHMDELQKKLDAALADAASNLARANKLDADLTNAKASLTAAEVAATNASATLTSERAKFDSALTAEKTRADLADKKAVDAVEKAKMDAQAGLAVSVAERVVLETHANRILGTMDAQNKPVDRSKLSDRDIKVQIIKQVDGFDVEATKVPAYVDGVYEGALTRAKDASASIAATQNLIIQPGANAPLHPTNPAVLTGPTAEIAARQGMANRTRNPLAV